MRAFPKLFVAMVVILFFFILQRLWALTFDSSGQTKRWLRFEELAVVLRVED
jgi:hypothetical protein